MRGQGRTRLSVVITETERELDLLCQKMQDKHRNSHKKSPLWREIWKNISQKG